MKNWKKVILGMALSFMVFFTAIGYAKLTDTLTISGTLNASAPNDIFITKITSIESLPTTQTGLRTMETTVSGGVGDTITYAIEVKNNTDDTYVYAGASEPFTAWTGDEDNKTNLYEITDAYSTGPLIGARETLTIYVQYTFMSAIETPTVAPVEFYFKEPIYTIEYINNEVILDTRYVYNNEISVDTKNDDAADAAVAQMAAEGHNVAFEYWMNSGSSEVSSILAKYPGEGDPKTVRLFPKFAALYTAMFVNQDGTLLDWCFFSAENVGDVEETENTAYDAFVATLSGGFAFDHWVVAGEGIDAEFYHDDSTDAFKSYNADVTLYPYLTYPGLDLIPVDTNGDGDIEYYEANTYGTSGETKLVEIPPTANGAPVTTINAYAFASYDDLTAVRIPASVEYIGGSAFADDDKNIIGMIQRQTVTLYYEGTKEQWAEYMTEVYTDGNYEHLASNWDENMGDGSRVFFLNADGKVIADAGYWELDVSGIIGTRKYTWLYHAHAFPYDSTQHSCSYDHNQNDTNYYADDRVDSKYWTDAATTSTFGLRETTPEETTAPIEGDVGVQLLLENITAQGETTVQPGADICITLIPDEGYALPEILVVSIDDARYEVYTDGTDHRTLPDGETELPPVPTFNPETSVLTIPASMITEELESVVITAAAIELVDEPDDPEAGEDSEDETTPEDETTTPEDETTP